MKPVWENIDYSCTNDSDFVRSERLKVPGGWIVRTLISSVHRNAVSVDQIFITDALHEWKLNQQ